MITRIVRMEFHPEKAGDFVEIFNRSCQAIRSMPGCLYLSLHQEENQPGVFFTISRWNDPSDLENYRQSSLFKTTWEATKALFSGKPAAWSLHPKSELI